jgi:hypothetical protein
MTGGRLLVVTGAAVADVDEVPARVRRLLDTAAEILVVTPILPGYAQWWASDTDRARHEADQRLNTVLGHMEKMNVPAEGRVGDEDPLMAFDDAVRMFRPDHIVIALRSEEHADWQERDLVEIVRSRFGLPVTVFDIDARGHVRDPGDGES